MKRGNYHELPPPPPEPPPEKPPPDELLELLDGLEDITLWADTIVELKAVPKDITSKTLVPSYHDGADIEMDSNFLIQVSETPKT